jgi:uncharacterized protein (DUF305 family)
MFRAILRAVPAAIAATFILSLAALAAPPHEEFDAQQASLEELAGLEGEEFEVGYINRLVPHHEGALMMAEVIAEKAVHDELRAEAETIIEAQTAEIDLLTTYLSDTYDQEVEPDPAFVMSPDMMAELESATPEMAEKMFLLMMREHHQSAIVIGEMALETGVADVLTEQANEMIASQREEQARFGTYLRDWYGIAAPEPTGDSQAAMELAMAEAPNTAVSLRSSAFSGPVLLGLVLLAAAATAAAVRLREAVR